MQNSSKINKIFSFLIIPSEIVKGYTKKIRLKTISVPTLWSFFLMSSLSALDNFPWIIFVLGGFWGEEWMYKNLNKLHKFLQKT